MKGIRSLLANLIQSESNEKKRPVKQKLKKAVVNFNAFIYLRISSSPNYASSSPLVTFVNTQS